MSSARAVLVTGGGSGIGAAAARMFAAGGWRVAICGRRTGALRAVAAETGALDRIADADADVAPDLQRLGLARPKAGIIRGRERARLGARIVAAVVGDGPAVARNDAHLVGHLRRRD